MTRSTSQQQISRFQQQLPVSYKTNVYLLPDVILKEAGVIRYPKFHADYQTQKSFKNIAFRGKIVEVSLYFYFLASSFLYTVYSGSRVGSYVDRCLMTSRLGGAIIECLSEEAEREVGVTGLERFSRAALRVRASKIPLGGLKRRERMKK
jgi:hypothetical protein